MTDVFNTAKRSEVMSRIRGKGNKTTEVALAAALRKAGISGWRRHVTLKPKLMPKRASTKVKPEVLIVKPDFIFRQVKLAVFVDGCFWHQCPLHSKVPENNREFWEKKLKRNVQRDKFATIALRSAQWRVLRLWEHELADIDRVTRRIANRLDAHSIKSDDDAMHLVARARGRSELKQAEALAVAQLHIQAERDRRAR